MSVILCNSGPHWNTSILIVSCQNWPRLNLGNIFLEANMCSVPKIQVIYVWGFFFLIIIIVDKSMSQNGRLSRFSLHIYSKQK